MKINFSGAGSVVVNTITNQVESSIMNGSTVKVQDALTLNAYVTSKIFALGGGATVGCVSGAGGKAAVTLSASVAINLVDNSNKATIDGSTVTSSGAVGLDAKATSTITAITIALAGSGTGGSGLGFAISATGAGSLNSIKNTTEASITGGSTVETTGSSAITLRAQDNSDIDAISGAVAVSGSGGAGGGVSGQAGASFAVNKTENTTKASISGSTVTALSVTLTSLQNSDLLAVSIGASGGGSGGAGGGVQISAAGSVTINETNNHTESSILSGSNVTTTGAVTLDTDDTSTILGLAGGATGGGSGGAAGGVAGALGASLAFSTIDNTTKAIIGGSIVTSGGELSCLLYTSPSPRDGLLSRMPSSA